MPARISIIIPVYNAGRYLALSVASVQAQSVQDWEAVLVNDGSTDGSLEAACELAARDSRIRVVNQPNQGVAAARNRGFAEVSQEADFITFFDQDDLWQPDFLASLIGALDANPNCVAAHCLARCIDGEGEFPAGDDLEAFQRDRKVLMDGRVADWPLESATTFGAIITRNCITTPGMCLYRRGALERVGGFEPSTVPCDDWDMSIRLCRLGDFAFVPRVLLHWRRHDFNASNARHARWRLAYHRVMLRALTCPDNTRAHRNAVVMAYRHACWVERRRILEAILERKPVAAARRVVRAALFHAECYRALRA